MKTSIIVAQAALHTHEIILRLSSPFVVGNIRKQTSEAVKSLCKNRPLLFSVYALSFITFSQENFTKSGLQTN